MNKNENLTLAVSAKLPLTHLELLQKYYLEVFNVEIVNTFIKEIKKQKENCAILTIQDNGNLEETLGKQPCYQMAVWVKDKNKIIFKDKILKFDFKANKTKEWIKYHMNDNNFVDLIDFQVSQYCQKYMKSGKDFNEIRTKNDDFQNKYRYKNDKIDFIKPENN